MLSYLPQLDPEGNTYPTFNVNQFAYIYGYATLADLLQYANLYVSNTFTAAQNFTGGIQVTSLNNIRSTTINYLANVTSDIQAQFQSILTTLTNYFYDSQSNTQTIKSNTAFTDTIILNQTNVNDIINNSILSNTIQTNVINTQYLYVANPNFPICYIYYGTAIYPIFKNGLISNLTGLSITSTVNMYITIAPNYQISFFTRTGILLTSVLNTTSDYIHYQGVSFGSYTPYNFTIARIV